MTYDVTLEQTAGPTRTIAVDEGETVLEATRRAGVRLPYDCRKGTCITCVGRLLALEDGDGETESDAAETDRPRDVDAFAYRRSPAALTDGERADGYVLLCIASPETDCRIEVGPRIRAEVGDSPWS